MRRAAAGLAAFGALAALPWAAAALGHDYYTGVVSRILVFGIAATSLNLILGYGGMVSFGHAAFFGAGAYAAAFAMRHGIASAALAWPLAAAAGALLAAAIGSISLRTRGVYFIMITLAFAQMIHYLAISLKALGGDDGIALAARAALLPGLDPASDIAFFYAVLAIAAATAVLLPRLLGSRFGHALRGVGENESRMEAIGFPVFRVKLAAFTVAGGVAGLAGALIANQNGLVTPNLLHWPQSGTLMVMVILGGVGTRWGGFIGAAVLFGLEEMLSAYTAHWPLALGALLLAVVLFSPNGIAGLLGRRTRDG
ncbi:MAG TPA: branched-chain amino acid ABC transporter permease [Usitatibacter sp.]|nr:branched-chain amino acid ABC transporter permease [Usitatibacter sp.]